MESVCPLGVCPLSVSTAVSSCGDSRSSWRDVRWGRLTQTRSLRQRQKGDSRHYGPWTHTSDDSYIYQLLLVLATAIVSFINQHQ